jgi:hypothetical protein
MESGKPFWKSPAQFTRAGESFADQAFCAWETRGQRKCRVTLLHSSRNAGSIQQNTDVAAEV